MKTRKPSPGVTPGSSATLAASAQPAESGAIPVVAVGASAGGLDAFTRLLQVFPPDSGLAIIFVQHLDPMHESMMVGLLKPHTKMTVREATNGTVIERDTVYTIAPGTYLAVESGGLIVGPPQERHG